MARELALRVLGRSVVPIGRPTTASRRHREIVELLTYEAAAPKPAPAFKAVRLEDGGAMGTHVVVPDATEERAVATARGDFSKWPDWPISATEVNSRSQQKRVAAMKGEPMPTFDHEHREEKPCKICAGRATPAPGAERLRERLQALPKLAQMWDRKGGTIILIDREAVDAVMREALAAAPPAPTDILREKEITVANHIRQAASDGCQCEPCIAARHASAERVREEIANELSSPYKESIFTPLSDDELMRCVDVLTNSGVRAASDRLHASWARHWSKVLRSRALPPSTGEKSQ
jgi:hypothetical protein